MLAMCLLPTPSGQMCLKVPYTVAQLLKIKRRGKSAHNNKKYDKRKETYKAIDITLYVKAEFIIIYSLDYSVF